MAHCNSLYVMGMALNIKEAKHKKAMSTKQQSTKNGKVEKVYSISGQAPSPSKDFLELIIGREQVIWRHWKISYKHHKKILPSEERLTHEEFKVFYRLFHPLISVEPIVIWRK